MTRTRWTQTAALGAVLAFGGASPATAQTFHMLAPPERGVWVEANYTDVKTFDQSFLTTFWYMSGRTPLTDNLRLTADVPFAYAKLDLDGAGPSESDAVFGNPQVGVEYLLSRFTLEGAVRLPLNSIDEGTYADVIGVLGDFQRAEAFTDGVLPISAAASYEHGVGNGSLRARAGVVGLIATDNEIATDEALVDYGVLGSYPLGEARLGLGLYGRWLATEDEGGFSDNSVHHAALSADAGFGRVRPGVTLRVPLDEDYRNLISSTVSLYLQIPLR